MTKEHSDSQLTVIQLNCRGLCSSFSHVANFRQQLQPDVVGICKTILTRHTNTLLEIPGYSSQFLHRSTLNRGGLAMHTRQEYSACISKELTWNIKGVYECQFLEMILPLQKKTTLGEVYRTLAGSVSSYMENLVHISDHLERQRNLNEGFTINLTSSIISCNSFNSSV